MQAATEAFLRHLDLERNASPRTLEAYAEDLAQFTAYLARELRRAPRPEDADHLLIRGFLAELHQRGLKKSSSARKLAALRTFFRYLCREGRLLANPAKLLLDRGVTVVAIEAGHDGNLLVYPEGEHWMPRIPVLERLAKAFGVPLASLLGPIVSAPRPHGGSSTRSTVHGKSTRRGRNTRPVANSPDISRASSRGIQRPDKLDK